jgi:hypothetical protein
MASTRTLIALVAVILAAISLALASTASAAAVKGDSASVGSKDCSLVRKDGTVRFGKCKDVCKGKVVKKDHTRQYGGQYYCKASLQGTTASEDNTVTGPDEVKS